MDKHTLILLCALTLGSPLLTLLLALLAIPLRRLFKLPSGLLGWATRLLSGVSLGCSILLTMGPKDAFPLNFTFITDFYLDALSVYFVLLVNLVTFFASWYTVEFLQHDKKYGEHHNPEAFHFFFNAFHLTMLIVPMVDNLVILWMAIELTTLASTLLVRYRRQRPTLEATWKYIIITTAGIVFALFGTVLLANATQSLEPGLRPGGNDLVRWSFLGQRDIAESLDTGLVVLSFLFILVGYGTKAGLAPMHTWLPDGHGEAPTPVSALLSGVLLKSALYAILRFYTITNLNRNNTKFTSDILLFSGLLSLVLATPFILKQNKFKRILAYHSLEHMGIIVFGIGIGGPVALFGALLHALNHALTKALMFLTFGHVRREYASLQGVAEPDEQKLVGVLKSMPISGVVLLLGGVGLVGSPPFNIFLSEVIIVWAALSQIIDPLDSANQLPQGLLILAIALFLITVTLIFGGLVGHLARLLLDRPEPQFTGIRDRFWHLIPLFVLLIAILISGIWIPTGDLLNQSVDILRCGVGGCP